MDKAKPICKPIWTVVASWFAPDGSDVDLAHAVTPPGDDAGGPPPWWVYDEDAATVAADKAERAGAADYDPDAARAWTVQHGARGHYFRAEADAWAYIRERWPGVA